jgi:hypothetical protein
MELGHYQKEQRIERETEGGFDLGVYHRIFALLMSTHLFLRKTFQLPNWVPLASQSALEHVLLIFYLFLAMKML